MTSLTWSWLLFFPRGLWPANEHISLICQCTQDLLTQVCSWLTSLAGNRVTADPNISHSWSSASYSIPLNTIICHRYICFLWVKHNPCTQQNLRQTFAHSYTILNILSQDGWDAGYIYECEFPKEVQSDESPEATEPINAIKLLECDDTPIRSFTYR
jgi:hypothetical protein